MSLTFQLPLPGRALSPNGRIADFLKRAARRAAKAAAIEETRRVLADAGIAAPGWRKVGYQIRWFYLRNRPDPDNAIACIKAYLDGIADMGVMVNDRDAWPDRPAFLKVDRLPRIEITITPEL